MWFLQFLRLPNLIIVALTQYLLYFLLLRPYFETYQIPLSLDAFHFFLLVLTTILIAASGYVINDILDYKIDQFNKPEKVFINNQISISRAWQLYYFIIGLGGVISIYLAIHVNQFPLFFIYPIAVFLLWAYSKYFKKGVLIGNIIVSVFCAFVAGIVLFAERKAFFLLNEQNEEIGFRVGLLFGGYLLFAFLSTMFREIIKDIEDIEGDRKMNCRTLPIISGIKVSKIIAFSFGIILFILIIFFNLWLFENNEFFGLLYSILGIVFPLGFAFWKLKSAESQKQFHQLSQLSKFIMLSGLILLIIINL